MKRFFLFPLLLLSFALGAKLSAQTLSGISIEAQSAPIVVYIDNTQVCKPTYSCYVALPRGDYRVRVVSITGRVSPKKRVIYEETHYVSGYNTEYINVERYLSSREIYAPHWERSFRTNSKGFELRPITVSAYKAFILQLKDCSFESDVKKIMTLFPAEAGITIGQFRELCSIPHFDDSRLVVARVLVPQILDLKECEDWKTPFSFISSQNEVRQLLRQEFEFRYETTLYPSFLW